MEYIVKNTAAYKYLKFISISSYTPSFDKVLFKVKSFEFIF